MPRPSPSDRWRWSITPFSIARMPVRVHVSVLFVLLMLRPYVLSPLAWLTWIVMVILHEVGHGLLVRREGGRVIELAVHGLGGECSYEGVNSKEGLERVAWGGVLAQTVLLLVVSTLLAFRVAVPGSIAHVAIGVNLWSIVFNLVPIAPLDGARAWPLLARWWRRAARKRSEKRRAKERRERQTKELEQRNAKLDELDKVTHTRDADEIIARVTGISSDSDR
jgi:Zn-dependent protease